MIREGDIAELVRSLQRAKFEAVDLGLPLARVIFFVGAGCSRSAGIPLASEIAQSLVPKLANAYALGTDLDAEEAISLLRGVGHFADAGVDGKTDWYAVYDECFSRHYKTPDHARSIFKRAIGESFKGINWAHLCLGELVAQAYCSTVITTNFDLLALEGLTAAGVIPVVSDGLESLGRISGSPDQAQLLQLNGSIHSYRLRNRPDEIDAVGEHSIATACFRDLVRNADVIVFVGYAGRETAIMRLLQAALSEFYEKEVYWCLYGGSVTSLTPESRELIDENPNARVLLNQDADQFFFDLCRGLGVGSPGFIRNPLVSMTKRADRIALPEGLGLASEIRDEIERFRSRLIRLENFEAQPTVEDHQSLMDRARDERFKGEDQIALRTLRPILGEDQVSPQVLSYGAFLAAKVAEQTADPAEIENAVKLSRRAFEAMVDKDLPQKIEAEVRYAQTLEMRGTGRSDLEDLRAALGHLESVESDIKRDKNPDLWAQVKDNIGIIYARIADATDNEDDVGKSIEAFDAVIEFVDRNEKPTVWAQSIANKAVALFTLGEFKGDADPVLEAASLHRQAMEVFTKDAAPRRWAIQMRCLASCYAVLSDFNDDVSSAEEAVRLIEESATASVEYSAASLAGHRLNHGRALARVGRIKRDLSYVDRGLKLVEEARDRFELLDMDWQVENASKTISEYHELQAEIAIEVGGNAGA